MIATRKSSVVLAFAAIGLLLLLYSSRSIRVGWSSVDGRYLRHDPHKSHRAPQASGGNVRAGASNTKVSTSAPLIPPAPLVSPTPAKHPVDPACEGFPDTSKVLLVMKTGASEAFARVPTQLMTVLRCLPDFLIFSDMEQDIAGHHIHDSLTTVLPEAREGNSDFDLYRRQKWCPVDQENCNKLGKPSAEGWNLDKYKNIHIAEKAYSMRPGYDWYLFVDADTYVLWDNLMQWLKQLDPTKKLYLGSAAMLNNFPFGHGGSGYLVSKAAMGSFVGRNPGVANEYDVRAKNECCGDYLFALALKSKIDVDVQHMWPTINGEKPATLPYGPSHWCHPIVTMHHMNSEEINTFWHFERKWLRARAKTGSASRPLVMKDIFQEYLAPQLKAMREDWDNLANNRFYLDTTATAGAGGRRWEGWQLDRTKKPEDCNEHERRAHRSFGHCAAACRSLGNECFMYRYQDGACGISDSFLLGKPVRKDESGSGAGGESRRVMSGWDVDKIRAWIQKQGECGEIRWPWVRTEI